MKVYSDIYKIYFDEDFGNLVFNYNEVGIFNIDINTINLEDTNFEEDDSRIIVHVILLAWRTKFEKSKGLKKELNKELMLVVWHPNRWWDWCVSEDGKKETDPMFIEEDIWGYW